MTSTPYTEVMEGAASGQTERNTIAACDDYHTPPPQLRYMNAIDDAQQRMKRKEKQYQCPICCKWIWSEHFIAHPLTVE